MPGGYQALKQHHKSQTMIKSWLAMPKHSKLKAISIGSVDITEQVAEKIFNLLSPSALAFFSDRR